MTKPRDAMLKPWLVALSVGATVGGWALLARQAATADGVSSQAATTTEPTAVAQLVAVELPAIPTVEALREYAAPASGPVPQVNLPPVSTVVEPVTRLPAPSTQAPRPQPAPPVATTRSSK